VKPVSPTFFLHMRHLFFFFLAPSFSGLPLLPSVDACAACASAPSTPVPADAALPLSPVFSGVDGVPLICESEGIVGSAVDVGTLMIGTLACDITCDAADTTDETAAA